MRCNRMASLGAALALSLVWSGASAAAPCRQALALALDISGSVDMDEYELQMRGMAGALRNPNVIDAFLAMPDAVVRLYIYEWAGLGTQRVLQDWTEITEPGQLLDIADRLAALERRPREVATALGRAMEFGAEALARHGDCWKRTLDISGDGRSNIGPRPRELKGDPRLAGLVINGLVIGFDPGEVFGTAGEFLPELEAYFRTEVIGGPDAFVLVANGFEDYERAMTRKLLREIEVLAVGMAVED